MLGFRQAKKKRVLRIYFVSDLHGSEVCFRKFLAAAKVYEPDVLILGGDFAGKGLVPVLRHGDSWSASVDGQQVTVPLDDYDRLQADVTKRGFYPVQMDEDELARINADPGLLDELFREQIREQARRWCDLVSERLDPSIRCIITPGNDDPVEADEIYAASDRVEFPSFQVCSLGPFSMASLAMVPTTPWNTERECSEEELAKLIDDMLEPLPAGTTCILNFHSPPYASTPGRRAGTGRLAQARDQRRQAEHRAGRQSRGAGGDQEIPAARRAARAHPRVARRPEDRPDAMHQPRQRLLFWRIAGRGRRPR